MIATYQISGQHLNKPATKYGVSPDFIRLGGWEGYIEEVIRPDIEWMKAGGLQPRILLHNPFCCPAGMYQFDQWLHAVNAGLLTTRKFIEAWLPYTTAGIEVIAYIGTQRDDPNFDERTAPGRGPDYARRINDSVAPICRARMSVAFDWSNAWQPATPRRDEKNDGREWEALEFVSVLIRDGGGEAYLEPAPLKTHPHTWGWPSITQARYHTEHQDQWADRTQNHGEVVIWADELNFAQQPAAVAADTARAFNKILDDGHTPAGIVAFLREHGYSAAKFAEAA